MKELVIELNMTKTCNFRCTYCYEQESADHVFKDDQPEFDLYELVDFIYDIKNSEFVREQFDGNIKLTFWGGEPLLRFELIKSLIESFEDYETVTFFLYTNGYFIKELEALIELTQNTKQTFNYQISYDGHKVHSRNRKTLSGEQTVDTVYRNIKYLMAKYKKPVNLKPTIPMGEDFQYLPDSFKDYLKLYYYAKDELKLKNLSNLQFKPTPTWAHRPSSKDATLENPGLYEKALQEVADLDKLFYQIEGHHFFAWFKPSLAVCGAGKGLITIDRDYHIYTCHNFLYYDPKDVQGHILYNPKTDELDVLFKNMSMFRHCNACKSSRPTDKCKNCDVIHCMRCNTAIFASSDKSDFLDKWTDYGAQNDICELFKINNKVYRSTFK